MSEKAARIEAELQGQRDALRSNFDELENKVKSVTDWRRHFQRHPGAMTAVAIGAGALLGALVSKQSRRRGRGLSPNTSAAIVTTSTSRAPTQSRIARQILDPLKDALIGAVQTRANVFLDEMLSEFQEGLTRSRTARRNAGHSTGEYEGSEPVRDAGSDMPPRRRRSDSQETPEAADIERSARDCASSDSIATAAMGETENMSRKRARQGSP